MGERAEGRLAGVLRAVVASIAAAVGRAAPPAAAVPAGRQVVAIPPAVAVEPPCRVWPVQLVVEGARRWCVRGGDAWGATFGPPMRPAQELR